MSSTLAGTHRQCQDRQKEIEQLTQTLTEVRAENEEMSEALERYQQDAPSSPETNEQTTSSSPSKVQQPLSNGDGTPANGHTHDNALFDSQPGSPAAASPAFASTPQAEVLLAFIGFSWKLCGSCMNNAILECAAHIVMLPSDGANVIIYLSLLGSRHTGSCTWQCVIVAARHLTTFPCPAACSNASSPRPAGRHCACMCRRGGSSAAPRRQRRWLPSI